MNKSFTEYVAIVETLIKHLKLPVDKAIKKSEAPLHLVPRLKEFFEFSSVKIRPPSVLIDPNRLKLPLCKLLIDTDSQPYTIAFKKYLLNQREWSRSIVENLNAASDKLVCRLPNPSTTQNFQSRGLVVGYIQSGKTANMAALIAKAADQGYRLFIVLAGIYKDLRAQTQDRLDQEITGDSQTLEKVTLVVHDDGTPKWKRMTKSGMEDFRPGSVDWDPNPKTPKLAVIKKHVVVMNRLIQWISSSPGILKDFPALIIDDEADQASINTKYGDVEEDGTPVSPSATNRRIRELLSVIPKCAYIGYTATPFANVLIDANMEEDLYPRDFIAVLDEPEGYFGPRQLFGLGMTPSELSPEAAEEPELDITRIIDEAELGELDSISTVGGGAEILTTSILTFILSCCARLVRGHKDHFTMLVHPSHQKIHHEAYRRAVEEEINFLREVVKHSSKATFKPIIDRAETLWNKDFLPLTKEVKDSSCSVHKFSEIWKYAKTVLDEIEIKVLNSDSEDELGYRSGTEKRYVVIGGNRLSRGLTLEGLSVSLFLRDSDQYDTLLQMGRWFGYRKGYQDLTRIFVEAQMATAFKDLARVELELREDLSQYTKEPNPPTPTEIMPKIRAHPTLVVTSALKMGAGKRINISLQHSRAETVALPLDNRTILKENQRVVGAWIEKLGPPEINNGRDGYIWADVTADKILEIIRFYKFSKDAHRINQDVLERYISKQNSHRELEKWDIVIPRGSSAQGPYTWAPGIVSRKVVRSRLKTKTSKRSSIRVLGSPSDISTWRDTLKRDPKDPTRGGLLFYVIDSKSGEGTTNPLFDDSKKGEDVIGLTFVFPESRSNATIEYVTQDGELA